MSQETCQLFFLFVSPLSSVQRMAGVEFNDAKDSNIFTAENVAFVIKNMVIGMSPGHNGLNIEHF